MGAELEAIDWQPGLNISCIKGNRRDCLDITRMKRRINNTELNIRLVCPSGRAAGLPFYLGIGIA